MYAIICDARSGRNIGVTRLALIDRRKTRRMWWTSDNKSLVQSFSDKSEAQAKADQLSQNNARVVPYAKAVSMMEEQAIKIRQAEQDLARQKDHDANMEDPDLSWDAHKV